MAQSRFFLKQIMMRRVVYSLIPIIIASIYFFGIRVLMLQFVVLFFGIITEYIFEKKTTKKPVSEAVIVSCILYTLTLPPRVPYWIASIGIIFGIFFGKSVFGGFAKNVFNPALVGRAFIYVNFPQFLTIEWTKSSVQFPGGFIRYINQPVESISTATPMLLYRQTGQVESLYKLFFGQVSGSIGETSAFLIILAGIYLIYTNTAAWQSVAGSIFGFLSMNTLLYSIGITSVPNPIVGLFSGGFLFASIFMVTDPISSASTKEGKFIYGFLIGIITVVIRGFALFAGGVMFAILIGNTFAPLIDFLVKEHKKNIKERVKINA